MRIPRTPDALTSLRASVPLQTLAYLLTGPCGSSVDQPRNLVKRVTVEWEGMGAL